MEKVLSVYESIKLEHEDIKAYFVIIHIYIYIYIYYKSKWGCRNVKEGFNSM